MQAFSRPRLNRLREKSILKCFVTGHDFSRADKPFTFVILRGVQAARNLLFRLFPQL
jgi:hypothetical protein